MMSTDMFKSVKIGEQPVDKRVTSEILRNTKDNFFKARNGPGGGRGGGSKINIKAKAIASKQAAIS